MLIPVLLLLECANPVSPTGGPKDVTPPSLVKAEPPLLTRNFTEKQVRIYFDEFVELKDINQQLIISPPMTENPEFKIKGKSVVIDFKENFKDSTTYNIFLGNAIVDISENNPIPNFQYVFSTGNVLDSMTFKGEIADAFTMEAIENLNVMLYLDNSDTIPFDSLPYFSRPYYMTKTDVSGLFQFNNLPFEEFKIFVLEDGNSNMMFDQVTERIAYTSEMIQPYYIAVPDSSIYIDSITMDTVMMVDTTLFKFTEPDPLVMFLFQEIDSVQKFIKASVVKKNVLMFVFKNPGISPEVKVLNFDPGNDWKLEKINNTKDTLLLWIKQEVPDSLMFEISDNNIVLDTVEVATSVRSKIKKLKKDEKEKTEKLAIKFGKKTELNTSQKVRFNFPVKSMDLTGSMLIENSDTLYDLSFRFIDSINLNGEFVHSWLENASYQFVIADTSFIGIGDQSHDTIRHNLKTKAIADYGNLYINASLPVEGVNYIIQLMKEDKILHQREIKENTRLDFEYLLPGNYFIKVIIDTNNNGKWDPGHYIYSIQPETVHFFGSEINIRANWDIEEDWEIPESHQ